MKPKKSPKADLKNKRVLFTEIGLIVSLSLCLAAFEWSSEANPSFLAGFDNNTIVEPDIDITFMNDDPKPELPKEEPPEPEIIIETITEVDDNEDTESFTFSSEQSNNPISPVIHNFIPEIKDNTELEPIGFEKVEIKPVFPGGDTALLKFISSNTKYPVSAKELGIEGKVYVQFVIGEDGKVTKVEIGHGVDRYLDEEAMRVVSNMPDWIPGKQRNKNVPVTYVIPINFKLY